MSWSPRLASAEWTVTASFAAPRSDKFRSLLDTGWPGASACIAGSPMRRVVLDDALTTDDAALPDLSAAAAVAAMRGGVLAAESYARSLLDRAERLGALNAFITLDPDQVLAAARECDRVRRIARTAYPGKGQLGHHNAAHVQRHARAQRLSPETGCRSPDAAAGSGGHRDGQDQPGGAVSGLVEQQRRVRCRA